LVLDVVSPNSTPWRIPAGTDFIVELNTAVEGGDAPILFDVETAVYLDGTAASAEWSRVDRSSASDGESPSWRKLIVNWGHQVDDIRVLVASSIGATASAVNLQETVVSLSFIEPRALVQ
jgi:hypothetical protein